MNKKILIVDDNELIVELMSYILSSNGYEVSSLTSGESVVAEIMLPGIDGRDICRMIKRNQSTKDLRVIICSGNDDIEEALKQEGAPDDVLPKPFDLSVLLHKVEHQLAA
jgi:CheY-like chemotaxis protein